MYDEIRRKLIPRYYWNRPNMMKLIDMLTSENKSLIHRLSKFVYNAFQIRNERLYVE